MEIFFSTTNIFAEMAPLYIPYQLSVHNFRFRIKPLYFQNENDLQSCAAKLKTPCDCCGCACHFFDIISAVFDLYVHYFMHQDLNKKNTSNSILISRPAIQSIMVPFLILFKYLDLIKDFLLTHHVIVSLTAGYGFLHVLKNLNLFSSVVS